MLKDLKRRTRDCCSVAGGVAGCFTVFVLVFSFLLLSLEEAHALPTLQTYIEGASAGSNGSDEETWFLTSDSSFSLYVVGAYGSKTASIDSATLLVSVPQGEKGTLTITSATDEIPVLLTATGQSSASATNPAKNADTAILTDVSGNSGYSSTNFLPAGLNLNNHYPVKSSVSDFLLYDLFSFDNSEKNLFNYDASNGSIEATTAKGEQKEYEVQVDGFSSVHFDVYAEELESSGGKKKVVYSWDWENNPGSHDATAYAAVPEPVMSLLLLPALAGLFFFRRSAVTEGGSGQ
ncbi:MAG: choice-of-anchor N protein [Alphaproteobacteria bacterium]|uniref:Choice-of-anchor N protein n=1 Tax=Candidatus Nitrobium versatile TaxID=2884831 RepID=A0A953J1S1_9BACT|nr:choice-of-anchor N protein [Candidatus Nitrobium versatile]